MSITPEERNKIVEDLYVREATLIRTKGSEYARDDNDTLANFKRIAAESGQTPEQVLYVYFAKHLDSLRRWVQNPRAAQSEPIEGRIDDLRTYLGCFMCRAVELEREMMGDIHEYAASAIEPEGSRPELRA